MVHKQRLPSGEIVDVEKFLKKYPAVTEPKKKTEPVRLPEIKLEPKKKTIVETIKEGRKAALETAPGLTRGLEVGAAIGTTVLAGFGIGAALGIGGGAAAASTVITKSATGAIVGKAATAAPFVTSVKSAAVTGSLLSKIGFGTSAAVLLGAIGSYPFAGFIKEEALQTLSFGVKAAMDNNDVEGMETAIAEQEEILNPQLWDKIFAAVPYANVLKQLKDFYDAARVKVNIDKKIVSDLRTQQETGETEDKKWERIREEEAEQDMAIVDYYNEQRKLMVEWEREAKVAARNEDAAFWRKEREKQSQKEAEDRKAIADFWLAYRKEAQKLADNSRPSNLNFGLL